MLSHFCRSSALGAALFVAAPASGQSEPGPAYLAYAGPHSSSPASAFGHLFLVLAASDSMPVPLWDVVSFGADTDGAGPLKFFVAGIVGGFSGRYERVPFHEKSRDYESIDDRDLWLLELRLSADERRRLDEVIDAAAGLRYPYTFFVRNCAWYLQELLARADVGLPAPSGLTSPTDVWSMIANTTLAGRTLFRPAAHRRIAMQYAMLDDRAVRRIERDPWDVVAADTAWIARLDPASRMVVSEYAGWRSVKTRGRLPPSTIVGLAALRDFIATNANEPARNWGADPDMAAGTIVRPPAFHRYTRISAGYRTGSGGNRLQLRIRPALHDQADPWVAHRPVNTLEFLTIEVSGRPETMDLRLESFVLFSQRSLTANSWLDRRSSWMLEAVLERGGLASRGLQAAIRTGSGKAFATNTFHAYGIITAGAAASTDAATLAIGFELGALLTGGDRWRGGGRWVHERDVAAIRGAGVSRAEIWGRRDLGNDAGVRIGARRLPVGSQYFIAADWYPR